VILQFFEQWISLCSPQTAVYFDITSISSYATNLDFVEWGYNRDHESLPQINMGIVSSKEGEFPLCYQVYPGSIADVSTLHNCLKRLEWLGIKDVVLILDRGFCSKANLLKLNKLKGTISFIQPLTFNFKLVKHLIKKHCREIHKLPNAFKIKEEILYYHKTSVDWEGSALTVHLYYNEKAGIDQRHNFLAKLLDFEKEIKSTTFSSMKEYLTFRDQHLPDKFVKFFKLNRKSMTLVRNTRVINSHLVKAGYVLLLCNSDQHERDTVLNYYRSRDIVEKMFDVEKNHLDGKRLRAHNEYNADGRIFVKFIALILHSTLNQALRGNKTLPNYSVTEILAELSKITRSTINGKDLISEISKFQRQILNALKISHTNLAQT